MRRNETDSMLALMCQSFNLDLASAKTVFYSDPFFDLQMKRVLVDQASGAILSCLTMVPTAVRIDPSLLLPICGIAGVCTHEEHRKMGLATALIESTMNWIAAESRYSLTALTAGRPQMYESLGWQQCAVTLDWSIAACMLPKYQEGERVQELSSDEASQRAHDIHRCYDQASGNVQAGAFVRDERRWRCVEKLTVGRKVAIYERDGSVLGYVAYEHRIGEAGKTVFVHEIVARDQNSRRAILGYFALGAIGSTIAGRCSHAEATALGLFSLSGVMIESKPNIHMRTAHLTKAMTLILSHTPPAAELLRWPEGLAVRIEPVASEPQTHVASGKNRAIVRGQGRRLQVSPDLDDQSATHWLAGDVGSITQMIMGYRTSSELVSEHKLRTSGTGVRRICDALFPRFEPFLAVPDVF